MYRMPIFLFGVQKYIVAVMCTLTVILRKKIKKINLFFKMTRRHKKIT